MALVRIYQKPAGTPANSSVFAVEIQQNNIWYTKKVSWEDLKGLIAGATSLVFQNGTVTFTTPDGVAHEVLSVDDEVLAASGNPVTGGAVSTALAGKQDTLTFDQVPTDGSTNPVESNGIYDALALKQDTLTFDSTPTDGSTNPVTSAGIYTAISAITTGIDWKEAVPTYADIATTYPNPQDGWTVTTLDDDHTYRYNGTAWVDLFSLITLATSTKDGLMSSSDFTKLSGIEAGANNTTDEDITDVVVDLTDMQQTASANPITLETKQAGLAKSCVVSFGPIQSGTGDPSPTNIRPISGRTQTEVANMSDGSENMITTPVTVNAPANVETYPEIAQISVEQGKTYYISCMQENDLVSNTRNTIRLATPQGNIYESINSNYHLQNGLHYVIYKAPATQNISIYMWCHTPNTAVTYDNFICTLAQNIIQFGQTVYGGILDLNSGVLTITYGEVDLGNLTYTSESSYKDGQFFVNISSLDALYNSIPYCENYKGVKDRSASNMNDGEIAITNSLAIPILRIYDSTKAGYTAAQFATALSGVKCVFELKTPTTIQLSPEAVTLLKGLNVISTDGDKVQVEFSDIPVGDYSVLLDYIKSLEDRIKALEGGN